MATTATKTETKEKLNIWQKLRKIQAELKAPKNMWNSFGKYNYRNAESILEALKPFEEKYDVCTTISDKIVTCGIGGVMTEDGKKYDIPQNYVKATVKFIDCETGETHEVSALAREDEHKGMCKDQCTGTASSYARKYALNGMFLLDDTKDADSDEFHNESEAKAKNTAPASNTTPASKPNGGNSWGSKTGGSGKQWGGKTA